MNILYLDCGMGAAGDMLAAALLELFPEPEAMVEQLNALGVPGVSYAREQTRKCGILGTRIHVYVGCSEEGEHTPHSHCHSSMGQLEDWLAPIRVSDGVKENIRAVYRDIARAESAVHGVPVEQIHFHEVGALDALGDVTAVCYLMERLGYPAVHASPVHVGSGHVSCAHGILPVPAPATAELLRGIPIYGGQIQGELCTPTGAALLRRFVTRFGDMPVMTPTALGYGMGKRDFAIANCLRALLGTAGGENEDTAVELSCNLDDMTGEEIGFAMEQLLAAGAPEVFTTPIGMKKNRPGTMLTLLCREDQREEMVRLLFRHTATLGIRETLHRRYLLSRHIERVEAPWGTLRCKISQGYGVRRCKPEYDDLSSAAKARQLSLAELRRELERMQPEKLEGNN